MAMEIISNPEYLDLKEKFHIKPFNYTKIKLTGPEKSLLRRRGTRLQAFAERTASSNSTKYQHFIEVCEGKAEPNTNEEHVWLKYRSMLEEEKNLKEKFRQELIHSSERDEYIHSRLLP